jgi:hypothetical protein
MAICGQVSFASHGLNEYIVHPAQVGPYGFRSYWSPSCIIVDRPVGMSIGFTDFQPRVFVLSAVVVKPVLFYASLLLFAIGVVSSYPSSSS